MSGHDFTLLLLSAGLRTGTDRELEPDLIRIQDFFVGPGSETFMVSLSGPYLDLEQLVYMGFGYVLALSLNKPRFKCAIRWYTKISVLDLGPLHSQKQQPYGTVSIHYHKQVPDRLKNGPDSLERVYRKSYLKVKCIFLV